MRCVIVLAGSLADDAAAGRWLDQADRLVCADGGARHLHRLQRRPDLLVGDMDSISPVDQSWLEELQVPVRKYPAAKNETDSELAILAALEGLDQPAAQHELVILGAMGNRPDHVLANQLLAASLAGQGWRLILTDGRSQIYTLAGGQTLQLDLPVHAERPLAVSAIPVTAQITGLTYEGLEYPLIQASLTLGSTRGLSNHIEKRPVSVRLDTGILLIIVTPED